jgi:hypothetical protein
MLEVSEKTRRGLRIYQFPMSFSVASFPGKTEESRPHDRW